MSTYYQGNSDIQGADGLQTLVLMNPSYVQYSDTPPPPPPPTGNLVFFNSAATSLTPQSFPPAPPPHTQQFVGIPLQAAGTSQDPNSHPMHSQHEMSAMHGFSPRVPYNHWNSIDLTTEARDTPRSQRGLSLSLSSQQHGFGTFGNEREVPSQGQEGGMSAENMRVSGGSSSSSMQSVLLNSKYLKALQELLEEVVNAGGGIQSELMKKANSQGKGIGESSVAASGDASAGGGDIGVKPSTELSTAERQEIQMKKAKLISMLDEVEQRYKQYHHQMQIVISLFEQAAGAGSAKTYTALALKTISKQFRCLKDAIMGQIRAAKTSLGEEDSHGGKIEGSRLKFVDHQLRQQRALQQLGMIQHNAWRPQRGLPERAVSVLRAWLFEHFLHPYPKDSDKIMLAKQTGLTRSQVSNWFINARVRLWKPMVEEMYQEELKENERNGSQETASKNEENDGSASKSNAQQEENYASKNLNSRLNIAAMQQTSAIPTSMASAASLEGSVQKQSGFTLIGASELEGITQGSPKKQRSLDMLQTPTTAPTMNMDAKPLEINNQQVSREGYSIMGGSPQNFTGGYGQYSIGELGRFDTEQFTPGFSGNNFSLSLGLPPSDNMSVSGNHHNFLPDHNIPLGRRLDIGGSNEFGSINTSAPTSAAAFDNIDIQNRKRFAAQLLHDFVA